MPIFLNTETTNESFQKSGKEVSFRRILKSSAIIYESSGLQFFRTTTRVQSESYEFDQSKFFMTFLTIMGVTEVLCSFRLVLEGKAGKAISESSRWEFLEKFLANNFALSDTEGNTSRWLNRGHIADLPLLSTLLAFLQKSPELCLWYLFFY